jgi:hypothetical protein
MGYDMNKPKNLTKANYSQDVTVCHVPDNVGGLPTLHVASH